MNLWSDFLTNRQRVIHKWKHYFPAYERHLGKFVNTDVILIEIGCGQGGSLQMWKRFFGPHARIIEMDINPACQAFEEDQIEIRIGDQSDPVFLNTIVQECGLPDAVLDDGSHMMADPGLVCGSLSEARPQRRLSLSRICTPPIGTSMKGACIAEDISSKRARI